MKWIIKIKGIYRNYQIKKELKRQKKEFKKQEKEYKKIIQYSLQHNDFGSLDLFSDGQLNEQQELNERNHLYSSLLKSYVLEYTINQNKKNRKKWQFYNIVTLSFVVFLLLLVVMSVVVTIFFNEEKDAVIISYFTSFIGIFSTLAIMPHTIVKYLFNPKEDEIISKLVTDMQQHDNRTKELNISKEKDFNEQYNCREREKGDRNGGDGTESVDGDKPTGDTST